MTKRRPPPLPLLADLLKADPSLEHRLKAEGRWHKVDAAWAFGSVETPVDAAMHPWREQRAVALELKNEAEGTRKVKAGP